MDMNRKRKSGRDGIIPAEILPKGKALRNKDMRCSKVVGHCGSHRTAPLGCICTLLFKKEKNDPEGDSEIIRLPPSGFWKGCAGVSTGRAATTQSPWGQGHPGRAWSRGRPPPSGVMFPCLEPYVWPEGRALSQKRKPMSP